MIEVQRIGKELVGFYRSERPIGDALLVDENQMSKAYEILESDNDRLMEQLAGAVKAQVRLAARVAELEKQLDLLAERHNETVAILEDRIHAAKKDSNEWMAKAMLELERFQTCCRENEKLTAALSAKEAP